MENEILTREEKRRLFESRTAEIMRKTREKAYIETRRLLKIQKIKDVLYIIMAALAAAAVIMLFIKTYPFTTYSVDYETVSGVGGSASLYSFGSGILAVGSDSLTYLEDGSTVWTEAVSFRDPIVTVRGNYFSVYDNGGYDLEIFDTDGLVGTISVSREIFDTDLSEAGVSAVLTQSSDAAYISYFDRFGSRLSVETKTLLEASGYPLDISVSPDGQKLAAVYYSTVNGIGESRLVIYDFENGREDSSYIISTLEDFEEDDITLVDSFFCDNTHVIAVGDRALVFTDTATADTCSMQTLPDQVISVYRTDSCFGVIGKTEDGAACTVYDQTGKKIVSFACPEQYTKAVGTDSSVLFVNGDELTYYSYTGKKRYSGTLTEKPVSVLAAGSRSYVLSLGAEVEKITLK